MANQRAEIRMTDDEAAELLRTSRSMTMATIGPTGTPHLVAMWYGLLDGVVWFETKAKSQKVQNLRRDSRITCMVEAGETYDQLRGVSIEGTAAIVDDVDVLWQVGISVMERYQGPYHDGLRPVLEATLRNRVAVRVDAARVRSWDHRKLGLPRMEPGGTTAAGPS